MQKKFLIYIVFAVLIMTGSFIVLGSSSNSKAIKKAPCTESMEDCCKKKGGNIPSGDMIWEPLSRQFISSVGFSR